MRVWAAARAAGWLRVGLWAGRLSLWCNRRAWRHTGPTVVDDPTVVPLRYQQRLPKPVSDQLMDDLRRDVSTWYPGPCDHPSWTNEFDDEA